MCQITQLPKQINNNYSSGSYYVILLCWAALTTTAASLIMHYAFFPLKFAFQDMWRMQTDHQRQFLWRQTAIMHALY